jgi:hypothetical protein
VFSWLQFILICLLSIAAAYAGGRSLPASLSSRMRKQLSQQSLDIEELVSELARLKNLCRTISNRIAVGEHRKRKSGEVPLEADAEPVAPPIGTPKHELRKFYGIPTDPIAAAKRVQELERNKNA